VNQQVNQLATSSPSFAEAIHKRVNNTCPSWARSSAADNPALRKPTVDRVLWVTASISPLSEEPPQFPTGWI